MRRLRDRYQARLFRGAELPRLMTMVMMLFVLAMMIRRASDTDTWRYFTGEPAGGQQSAAADEGRHKPHVRPRSAVHSAGAAVFRAPEVDTELAMAIEPAAQGRASTQDEAAAQRKPSPLDEEPAVSADFAPTVALAEPNLEPANEPAAPVASASGEVAAQQETDQTDSEDIPKTSVDSAATDSAATDSAATDSAATDSAPTATPAAETESNDAAPVDAKSDDTKPAEPVPSESAPAAPATDSRPRPLFRPHLPANPETYLQPGTEPEKPEIEPGPLDEDEQERLAFDHECEAISDRTALGPEEMFAYFRLLRWAQSQTPEQMLKRARGGVRYGDVLEHPEEYRGELLKEKLHIARVRREDTKPGMPFDFQHYYEALGWNDSTQTWFYFCIFVDLPEGMPVGDRVYEEGTFVGYFLKTFVYQDGQGKKTKAPILIGRMIYHPAPVISRNADEWLWGCAVGGVLFVLFLARWGWRLRGKRAGAPQIKGLLRRDGLPESDSDGLPIEDWLEQVESQPAETEIKSAAGHDLNGSAEEGGLPLRRDHGLDWTEDRER